MTLADVAAAAAEGFRRMNGGTFDAGRWHAGFAGSRSPAAMAVARAGALSQHQRASVGVWPQEAARSGLAAEAERQDAIFRATGTPERGPLPF